MLELVDFYEQKNKEQLSKDVLDTIVEEEKNNLSEEYFLTAEEFAVINKSFAEYKEAISNYRI